MNDNHKDIPWIDGNWFNENTSRFPAVELAKYYGKHVAWSLDGCRILASGEGYDDLMKNILAAELEPSEVVLDYVSNPDESLL